MSGDACADTGGSGAGQQGGETVSGRSEPQKWSADTGYELVRLTLVGPLPIPEEVIGGTKVSFHQLVDELSADERYKVDVVNTSRRTIGASRLGRFGRNLSTLTRVVKEIWMLASRSDVVMWNVSPEGAIQAGLLVRAICAIHRRPLIIRFFGGDLDIVYRTKGALARWIIDRCLLSTDAVLLQTQGLVEWARFRARVLWYPTTRNMASRQRPLPACCTRILYVGQLRPEKGLREIIDASCGLPEDIEITVAGPKMRQWDPSREKGADKIKFRGPVDPSQIPELIQNHDAMLFPSFYTGEGYPGSVIEALQLGVPVIASRWRALPELVEDGTSGILVEPGDAAALADAIMRLHHDQALFQRLQEGAARRGALFRSDRALQSLSTLLHDLATG